MSKNYDDTVSRSLQEYRDFIEGKDTKVLIHTVAFEETSDFSSKNIKDIKTSK